MTSRNGRSGRSGRSEEKKLFVAEPYQSAMKEPLSSVDEHDVELSPRKKKPTELEGNMIYPRDVEQYPRGVDEYPHDMEDNHSYEEQHPHDMEEDELGEIAGTRRTSTRRDYLRSEQWTFLRESTATDYF